MNRKQFLAASARQRAELTTMAETWYTSSRRKSWVSFLNPTYALEDADGIARTLERTGSPLVHQLDEAADAKRVLVVGESNTLEYSWKLHQKNSALDILVTTYDDVDPDALRTAIKEAGLDIPIPKGVTRDELRKGIDISMGREGGGLRLMTGVDARKLHLHPRVRGQGFSDIVFTNPRGPDNIVLPNGTEVANWNISAGNLKDVLNSASQGGVPKPGGVVHFSSTY
jgi:hypothetical protein